MSRIRVLLACAAGAAVVAQPVPGPVAIFPLSNTALGLAHCNYVASARPVQDGDADFSFTVVAALNGASSPAFSVQSQNYPTYYLAIVNTSSGAVGIVEAPDVNDATWNFVTSFAKPPPGTTDAFSVQSMSKGSWGGKYLYFATTNNAPCNYQPPAGDAMLADPSVDPSGARLSWIVGPLPPANLTSIAINAGTIVNPSVSRKIMGCHHDYGFAQAPRGFYANMIYGSQFGGSVSSSVLGGTCAVPAWTTRMAPGTVGSTGMTDDTAFSAQSSMQVDLDSSSSAGSQVALVNRGMCGAGLSLVGGQTYTVSLWVWTGGNPAMFVELRDFTSNTSLARADFTAQSTGPDWGSTWFQYNFTLTTSAGTACSGIPYGSDPTIDCGGNAGPAHVCVRCGGEFLVGLSGPGNAKIGYVEVMPGPWGLLQGPNGPLPVLKSGADVLQQLGVTVMRRGPAWNRPSVNNVWGSSLLAGWGPFEVIDMANALAIEPIVTLAYDSNDEEDWADLVEYCWGDATSTTWGRRRARDGHPQPYNITTFELGNEQYNPNFVAQVAAMEARAAAVGAPPLHYMFPSNGGVNAADAQTLLNLNIPGLVERIMPDLHVGAGGAVEAAAGLFNAPPVAGFNQSAINCETNAGTHDHARALAEAADLIDWMTADPAVTNRLYARTASFCTGSSNAFDQWDQGISFFLPNMTWLQPPGYVHVMVTATWAEQTVQATWTTGANDNLQFAAQKTADGKSMVLRAVTGGRTQPLQLNWAGASATGPSYTLWTLTGQPAQDNTPSNPSAVSPQQASVPISAGATGLSATLQPNTFAIMVIPLQ